MGENRISIVCLKCDARGSACPSERTAKEVWYAVTAAVRLVETKAWRR